MSSPERLYFDSFMKVFKAMTSTLDLKEVMEIMMQSLIQRLELKAAAVRLLNSEKRTLDLLASRGLSEEYVRKGPVDADRSIAEALSGAIAVVPDARNDHRIQYCDQAAREGLATIISIPLSLKNRVIGVLRLYTAEPRELLSDEMDFAVALSEMGAIAIENARLHEEVKKNYETVMGDLHSLAKEQYWQ